MAGRLRAGLGATVALGCVGVGGCATVQVATATDGTCSPARHIQNVWRMDAAPRGASREELAAALLGMRDEARRVWAGKHSHGADLVQEEIDGLARVGYLRMVVDATAAELDCESERADHVAAFVDAKEETETTRLTIASIVASGITTVLTGVSLYASTTTQVAVAVTGGTVSAGLAVLPLVQHHTIDFRHRRNALADIWLGPSAPGTFPAPIWAYLTDPAFSSDAGGSIRDHLVAEWKDEYQAHGAPGFDDGLLFGAGGRYDADTLHRRTAMLHEVAAEVRRLNEDLAAFAATLPR